MASLREALRYLLPPYVVYGIIIGRESFGHSSMLLSGK
ncbi:MAG: hypothetical protein KatS3mg025_0619 [Bacteroidia bacterium]|nr:MAG: hypothetical protein KatS3mg025_0619 [Bacteroidia bacterium]